jgi:hypothetical protein
VGAFDTDGHFYFGFLAYNGNAGKGTNSDVAVARFTVVNPSTNHGNPLDYIGTTRVASGPSAANFRGIFSDKNMIEVDRTGGAHDGDVYMCWTKFPGIGNSTTIQFSRSTNGGATFSKSIGISGKVSGQGCDIAVEADGDVYVDWRDFAGTRHTRPWRVVGAFRRRQTFGKVVKVAPLVAYNPFDTARTAVTGSTRVRQGSCSPVSARTQDHIGPTGQLRRLRDLQRGGSRHGRPQHDELHVGGSGSGRAVEGVSLRSLDNGQTWVQHVVANNAVGHQFFPDADALSGTLAVVWQDSRVDNDYSVQRPVGNLANATSSGTDALSTFAAVSTNGTSFGAPMEVASVRQQPQYEMFDAASVPFLGDHNWIQLAEAGDGSLFGYMTWTDNRDVITGTDPREATQDGFDVKGCWVEDPPGTFTRTCLNGGGYNQSIYEELDHDPVARLAQGVTPDEAHDSWAGTSRSPDHAARPTGVNAGRRLRVHVVVDTPWTCRSRCAPWRPRPSRRCLPWSGTGCSRRSG